MSEFEKELEEENGWLQRCEECLGLEYEEDIK